MNWNVRYIDYPKAFQKMERELMDTVHSVLKAGDLIHRQQQADFESNLAKFVGTKHAIGVTNCTAALELALRAAGCQEGDEVITVAHTFVATAAAIHHAGGTPVLVDIGDDHLMNPDEAEKAITEKTRFILPVQLNGRICNMDRIGALARKYNLTIIEDSAQALGGSYKGTGAGAFGAASCFSFYPAKLLGAYGDAGAVTTNDDAIAEKIRLLRHHGLTPEKDVAFWSFNCRMDNLQAALLDLKLKRLPEWLDRRREIARMYDERLCEIAQLHLPPPPQESGDHHDVFQNYEMEAGNRDGLVAHLKEQGIETLISWGGKAVHQFKNLGFKVSLPRTEKMMESVIMIPMHVELENDQIEYVAESIRKFYR